ncbi:hypothetical protein FDZ71_03265, partial [bacterium]
MLSSGKYLLIFVEEGRDLVSRLEKEIVRLESNPKNRESMDNALRLAHTLKGSARMVGLVGVSKAAHGIENVLSECAMKEEGAPCEGAQLLLDVVDRMRRVFSEIEAGKKSDMGELDA